MEAPPLQIKFCKDCKHRDIQGTLLEPWRWRCGAPQNFSASGIQNSQSLVTGEQFPTYKTCEDARKFHCYESDSIIFVTSCGSDGHWFEQRKSWVEQFIEKPKAKKQFEIGKDL